MKIIHIPLKNHKGHATFCGKPSKKLIDAVNALADAAYKMVKKEKTKTKPLTK